MGLFSFLKRKPKTALDCLEADEVRTADAPLSEEGGFRIEGFWHDNDESVQRHICAPATEDSIRAVEEELGYRLPDSYKGLLRHHNGGLVNRCRYRVPAPGEGCPDMIYITEILGIGSDAPCSLCGRFGSRFLINSRRHNPEIGVAVCNTTLPGRALVFLDYRKCGPKGEPCVTYSDAMTGLEMPLARDFESFVLGLEDNIIKR